MCVCYLLFVCFVVCVFACALFTWVCFVVDFACLLPLVCTTVWLGLLPHCGVACSFVYFCLCCCFTGVVFVNYCRCVLLLDLLAYVWGLIWYCGLTYCLVQIW